MVGSRCIAVIDTGGSVRIGPRAARRDQGALAAADLLRDQHARACRPRARQRGVQGRQAGVRRPRRARRCDRAEPTVFSSSTIRTTSTAARRRIRSSGPTKTVADTLDLDLGAHRLHLRAWPKAHTDCDLTVLVDDGVLWTGDLVFRERVPALDGSVKGWLAALDELARTNAQSIVPGHGAVTRDLAGAIAPERRYLEALVDGVGAEIAAGNSIEDAIAHVGVAEKPHWKLWDTAQRAQRLASRIASSNGTSVRRREFLALSALAAHRFARARRSARDDAPRIVIVGGGFGGSACALQLKRGDTSLDVTLIDPDERYVTCPMSNEALVGLRSIDSLTITREGLRRAGVRFVRARAQGIDADAPARPARRRRQLDLRSLRRRAGHPLSLGHAGGLRRSRRRTHAARMESRPQTELLAARLRAMDDGGIVAISVPSGLMRCPPGPYERASLIAEFLKRDKAALESADLRCEQSFSAPGDFHGGMGRGVSRPDRMDSAEQGGAVLRVDARRGTCAPSRGAHRVAVANMIPPQAPGAIAARCGARQRPTRRRQGRARSRSTASSKIVAHAHDAAGNALTLRARYFVDASGRDTLLGNALKLKRKNDKHQSAAIFAHFRGVERRPGEDAGNISIYNFEYGWCWFIPLRDGVMSVGCVCWPEYLKQRRGRNEAFLLDTLKMMPEAWARMAHAEMISDVRVTGNYSYTCERMAGPGWVMVGDAFAFVDPVFSSGVYLAMHSGKQAAALVDAVLREPAREAALQAAFSAAHPARRPRVLVVHLPLQFAGHARTCSRARATSGASRTA